MLYLDTVGADVVAVALVLDDHLLARALRGHDAHHEQIVTWVQLSIDTVTVSQSTLVHYHTWKS